MKPQELLELVIRVSKNPTNDQQLELVHLHTDGSNWLYSTLSSFSNQNDGGTILFCCGDASCSGVSTKIEKLRNEILTQGEQMEPEVHPEITVLEYNGEVFVSAEIQGLDLTDRPCFYKGKGKSFGAYTRIGGKDELQTECERYQYESFKNQYRNDSRPIERAALDDLNLKELNAFIETAKSKHQYIDKFNTEQPPTLAIVMLFGLFPQAFFPRLGIIATHVQGEEVRDLTHELESYIEQEYIEGTIPQLLERALRFVRRNIRVSTYINPQTGMREDRAEYSIAAIREALLNALVHRDYSVHTEGQPIQLQIFSNRIEITNPGGLYGRLTVDQLGNTQPDTRNPVLISMMEVLKITENRYSGIPTMIAETQKMGMEEPQFSDKRGSFCVTFFNKKAEVAEAVQKTGDVTEDILKFCQTPKSRQEISDFLGIATVSYTARTYIKPLLESGRLKMTLPDNPRSSRQKFVAA